jgi:hypothetical protein
MTVRPWLRFDTVEVVIAAAELSEPHARYAQRMHAAIGDGHHVASPLGAWLLLALCARAATGAVRDELTDALGVDVETAATVAAELLGRPHPLFASAAAVWSRSQVDTEDFLAWRAGLPAAVETGELPNQEQRDKWATERTLGRIEGFPGQPTPDLSLVLATVLATRVLWEDAFHLAPASDLGPTSAWAGQLKWVLRATSCHAQFIAATDAAGDVAVHSAPARDGLTVTSVAAAPDVSALKVLAAAYELATSLARRRSIARRSLFDLPLGDGPLWTLTEEPAEIFNPSGREEWCRSVLPAWSARSHHDLCHPSLGFPAAAAALAETLGLRDYPYQASQSVEARYSREGFEAGAITSLELGAVPDMYEGVLRVAELRFGHPFAVVAVTTEQRGGRWDGVPVFSAWVASPDDAGGDVLRVPDLHHS